MFGITDIEFFNSAAFLTAKRRYMSRFYFQIENYTGEKFYF